MTDGMDSIEVYFPKSGFSVTKINRATVSKGSHQTSNGTVVTVLGMSTGGDQVEVNFVGGHRIVMKGFTAGSIWITPAMDLFGHVTGLCGTYDACPSNDFTTAVGEVVQDITSFGESCMLLIFLLFYYFIFFPIILFY